MKASPILWMVLAAITMILSCVAVACIAVFAAIDKNFRFTTPAALSLAAGIAILVFCFIEGIAICLASRLPVRTGYSPEKKKEEQIMLKEAIVPFEKKKEEEPQMERLLEENAKQQKVVMATPEPQHPQVLQLPMEPELMKENNLHTRVVVTAVPNQLPGMSGQDSVDSISSLLHLRHIHSLI